MKGSSSFYSKNSYTSKIRHDAFEAVNGTCSVKRPSRIPSWIGSGAFNGGVCEKFEMTDEGVLKGSIWISLSTPCEQCSLYFRGLFRIDLLLIDKDSPVVLAYISWTNMKGDGAQERLERMFRHFSRLALARVQYLQHPQHH